MPGDQDVKATSMVKSVFVVSNPHTDVRIQMYLPTVFYKNFTELNFRFEKGIKATQDIWSQTCDCYLFFVSFSGSKYASGPNGHAVT